MKTILLWDSKLQFEQIDPTECSEDNFESLAIDVLKHLYPDCHVLDFKPTITYEGEGWQPDLAIVEKNYNYWFVIEVETASHSLQKHVLPQVRAFLGANYGQEAETKLAEGLKISLQQAKTLTRLVPRYVAVVSNHESDEWQKALAAENVQFLTISNYQTADAQKPALLINGTLHPAEKSIGFGTVQAQAQSITLPKTHHWEHGKEYKIKSDQGSSTWACTIESHAVWLTKTRGSIGIPDKSTVQFLIEGKNIQMRKL